MTAGPIGLGGWCGAERSDRARPSGRATRRFCDGSAHLVWLLVFCRYRPLSRGCCCTLIPAARSDSVRVQSSSSHAFAGQPAGLRNPFSELLFVEQLVLVNVQVANGLLL